MGQTMATLNRAAAILIASGMGLAASAAEQSIYRTATNRMVEIALTSERAYADPFNEVQLDVVFTEPDGRELRVPAFWAGGQVWRVRYASPHRGVHRYRSQCSDVTSRGLHGIEGKVEITAYQGDNPLYRHGPVRVAADRRHFEHADGTPFLWLGDTWWMGLCRRLPWPDGFKPLAADRRQKGFNVVQIVAGLYPDMGAFDERGLNEAGFPWQKDYSRINPEYFDAADQRLAWLVDNGLSPCIVGAWGYHLPWLGVERMQKHWRYLIARYGAWPVIWCAAGEGTMPYYLSKHAREDSAMQKHGWTQVVRSMRRIDPYHRMITVHPSDTARNTLDDPALLDFDMLQTGHSDRGSIPNTIRLIRQSREAQPPMPTVVGEVCYEGILDTCFEEVQRFMVWASYLSGTAGHTYGANGIWQVNCPGTPYGASPHGGNWGNRPWNDAMTLPGSRQTGLAHRLIQQLPWPQFEAHPEWASYLPAAKPEREEKLVWGDWIWYPEGNPVRDAPAETRYFRRTFEIPLGKSIVRTVLRISADDRLTAYLNGAPLGTHADWQSGREFRSLASHLRPGRNVLAVAATNGKAPVPENPAGLIAALDIGFADGTVLVVPSDATWRSSRTESRGWQQADFDDRSWVPAMFLARYGQGPWGNIGNRHEESYVPFAAGIPGKLCVVYLPVGNPIAVRGLQPDTSYKATWFNPVNGEETSLAPVRANAQGGWTSSAPPSSDHDWVLMLQ
jgi:hypothetical protein